MYSKEGDNNRTYIIDQKLNKQNTRYKDFNDKITNNYKLLFFVVEN